MIPQATLDQWRQAQIPPVFTPGNLVFASLNESGKVGSIYFNQGRIRLTHSKGPATSIHNIIERYTISEADYQAYKKMKRVNPGMTLEQKYEFVARMASRKVAEIGDQGRLFEFFGPYGIQGNHPSRGAPVAFNYPLGQEQINLLYMAAQHNNNAVLKEAMASDPLLRAIPVN